MADIQQQTAAEIFSQLPSFPVEGWVDAEAVAAHTGFKSDHIRKLARQGKIPATNMRNGRRDYWRFKLSLVDAVLTEAMKEVTLD